jgi:hypothetical protein
MPPFPVLTKRAMPGCPGARGTRPNGAAAMVEECAVAVTIKIPTCREKGFVNFVTLADIRKNTYLGD